MSDTSPTVYSLLQDRVGEFKCEFKELWKEVNELNSTVAALKMQIRIIYMLVTMLFSGIVGMFFYSIKKNL